MGVIVTQRVTGSPPLSGSGRWWGSPRQACCSWLAGLKGCVFGQSGLKLLVSYNPPPPLGWSVGGLVWMVCLVWSYILTTQLIWW